MSNFSTAGSVRRAAPADDASAGHSLRGGPSGQHPSAGKNDLYGHRWPNKRVRQTCPAARLKRLPNRNGDRVIPGRRVVCAGALKRMTDPQQETGWQRVSARVKTPATRFRGRQLTAVINAKQDSQAARKDLP